MATLPEEGTSKQQILEARARALAEKPDVQQQAAVYDTVVVVTVGEEKLGIPAGCLRAIGECSAVTPVFGTPSWLAGITHLRGELLSVVHLAHWLGQPHRRQGPRLAIVEGLEGALGLLIDEVIGFREVLESDLSTALSPNAATQRFTRVITKDLVTILDVGQLLTSAEIIVDQSATVIAPSTGSSG